MNPVNDSHPHVIEVSSSYIDYIKWCLEGGPILGDFLLEEIDFSNGSLMAFLPNDRWDDVLLDPRMGLPTINRQEMPAVGQSYIALYRLAQFLHKHMAEINCAGIVVDYLSIPSDPIVERWGGRDHLGSLVVLDFDKEVYYYFCQAHSVEYVQELLWFAKSVSPFYGILWSLNDLSNTLQKGSRKILPMDLRLYAKEARVLFFGAFDGEGYVVWMRNSQTTKADLIPESVTSPL